MPSYRIFIWEDAMKQHSDATVQWLKDNYMKKLSLEEFSKAYVALPHDHPHPGRCKSPNKLRRQYNHLRDRFGFFTGVLA